MSDIFGPFGPDDDDDYYESYELIDDPVYNYYPEDISEWEQRAYLFSSSLPDEWNEYRTLENDYGEEFSRRVGDWYNLTLGDPEYTMFNFGMEPLDIIRDLEARGLWDSDDWEIWRAAYEESL